ncbi:MAG: Clp protease ClpP [Pseudonocardia sp.]|nr:Clp protease ClpP [Pseudonocardia sp.]
MTKPLARALTTLSALAAVRPARAGLGCPLRLETAADTATVYIYEEIGGWGIWASDIVPEIAELDVAEVQVRLSSPGGDYFDGLAIANALAEHPANVVVHVDALAASAASVIAMAGDEIVMHPGARMMIHDALTVTVGNAADHRKTVDLLDSVSADISELYAFRTGRDTAGDWRARMLAESWFSADEAVAAGLASRVAERPAKAEPVAAESWRSLLAQWRATVAAAAPEAPAPAAEALPPAPAAGIEVDLSELIRSAVRKDTA